MIAENAINIRKIAQCIRLRTVITRTIMVHQPQKFPHIIPWRNCFMTKATYSNIYTVQNIFSDTSTLSALDLSEKIYILHSVTSVCNVIKIQSTKRCRKQYDKIVRYYTNTILKPSSHHTDKLSPQPFSLQFFTLWKFMKACRFLSIRRRILFSIHLHSI